MDLTRCFLYILLPICFVYALFLVWQGVPQNFNTYIHVTGIQGFAQTIAQGPVASQEAIKMFGTNGGGFFNANSAHPYENPTPFTNLIEMLSIFALGAGLIYMFGKMAGNTKQGWTLFGAVSLLFLLGAFIAFGAEQAGNPALANLGVNQAANEWALAQPGGNMEGKEMRFGIASSTLFATITTDASCGAINSWHDSYTPIGGMVPLVNIGLGEIVFGGVGSGLYGLVVFAVLAVFIAGLMVGRTPEYLGKKIEQKEMKMAAIAILILPLSILGFSAIAAVIPPGVNAIYNPGPHGLSEMLYAFSSMTGNNGSAFAGLGTTTVGTLLHLLQLGGRVRHADRTLRVPDPRHGAGRLDGRQEDGARRTRDLPDHDAALLRPASRCDSHRRRADILPGVCAGADRRAAVDDGGQVVLMDQKSSKVRGEQPIMIDRDKAASSTPEDAQAPENRPGRIGSDVAKARRPRRAASLFDPAITRRAIVDSFKKLDPRIQARNPVMFVVEIGSVVTTIEFIRSLVDPSLRVDTPFILGVTLWLWFTVLFANFAEAMAEGRGKAQADTLRRARSETMASRLLAQAGVEPSRATPTEQVPAPQLRKGDMVLVAAGDLIPGDGDVVAGVASVDESAITGESAPVIRESGGDRSAVTGGTRVLSDWIIVRVTSNPGETFLDRMIALVEGASRQKTPNEIALNILLASLTLIFLLAVVTLEPFAIYSGEPVSITALIALLVCLIPTTIGGLLSSIGIAGMDRLVQRNVLAMSGRAVEAAGDVDVLLLDKTGTITLGNRMATEFLPVSGVSERDLAEAALLSSLPDETPEGRSIVVLGRERCRMGGAGVEEPSDGVTFIPFSASTRMSGVDLAARDSGSARQIRKGAGDAVRAWVSQGVGSVPTDLAPIVERIARAGGTPLVVAESAGGQPPRMLGVIALKDIVKSGMRERFDQMRRMGIRTVMITGDNPLTAAAIAAEAGVDDFLAQATPEAKLQADPRAADRRAAGGDDRRRHERRSRAGAGRCGRGDEHRHAGRQRGRQHGGPRLQSDQADRDRRGRQAAADDARRADHIQHRQRCGEILRHHPGGLRSRLSATPGAQHHGAGHATQRGALGGDLQRADHHRADPAGATRRQVPPARSGQAAATQPADLRRWGHHSAVHRHQVD